MTEIKEFALIRVDIDPDEWYNLFGEDVTGQDILDFDFSYLSSTAQLALSTQLLLNKSVSMFFHPDIQESITKDREASIYYGKDAEAIKLTYAKEKTKNATKSKEANAMKKTVDLSDQTIRTKRNRAINYLVEEGYDRAFVMDELKRIIDRDGAGILNLTPKRIAEKVNEELH